MLQRLQDSKSIYDVDQWNKDRFKKVQMVGRISKFDYVLLNSKDFKAVPGGFQPRKSNSNRKIEQV